MAGRPKLWTDVMTAKFPLRTFELISKCLEDGEDRTDFVRTAVEMELRRRLPELNAKSWTAADHFESRYRDADDLPEATGNVARSGETIDDIHRRIERCSTELAGLVLELGKLNKMRRSGDGQ